MGLILTLALLFVGFGAWAHDGASPEAAWYRSLSRPDLTSITGKVVCCGVEDCVPTAYRITADGYEVPSADGLGWETVPPEMVIHTENPIGRAVLCRYGVTIRCFVPSAEG